MAEKKDILRLVSDTLAGYKFALAGPDIRLLWRGGDFDPAAAQASAFVLLFFAPGLVGLAAMQVLNRVFYAVKDRWTPPIVGVAYVGLSIALTLWLMRLPVGYGAIGLAASIAWTLGFLVLLPLARSRLGGFDLSGLVVYLDGMENTLRYGSSNNVHI